MANPIAPRVRPPKNVTTRKAYRPNPSLTTSRTHFLDHITVEHGPPHTLASFFARSYAEVLECGQRLEFSNLATLHAANQDNLDSWSNIIPIFDPQYGEANDQNCVTLLARNRGGEIVCTQSIRLINVPDNLYKMTESLRIFYGKEAEARYRRTEERWNAEGRARDVMATLNGSIAYSGAAWCHPSIRGGHLARLLVRICRAYALTKWNAPYTVTYMAEGVVKGGFAQKVGHRHIEWSISARNCCVGNVDVAFLWLTRDEAIDDLNNYLALPMYTAAGSVDGRAQDERLVLT